MRGTLGHVLLCFSLSALLVSGTLSKTDAKRSSKTLETEVRTSDRVRRHIMPRITSLCDALHLSCHHAYIDYSAVIMCGIASSV